MDGSTPRLAEPIAQGRQAEGTGSRRRRRRLLSRLPGWIIGGLLGIALLTAGVNLALSLMLFGPERGAHRLVADWRRIWLAHRLETEQITPQQAFESVYGATLGEAPRAQDVRRRLSQDFQSRQPIVWDVILARYLLMRFGAIDGRSVPPGVYVAAGPIGPDAWPAPIITHYFFPRHGYVLVVPPAQGDQARPAIGATASLRRDFRPGGDGDDISAVVQLYGPEAFDFPTPGEPIHDLFLISDDPRDVVLVERRIRAAAKRLNQAQLGYGLFSRNSNSAMRCFLRVSGVTVDKVDTLRSRPLARLRLPGVAQALWKPDEPNGIAECSEP